MKRFAVVVAVLGMACQGSPDYKKVAAAKKPTGSAPAAKPGKSVKPTVAQAREWMDAVEKELLDLWIFRERAAWVQTNFITHDTEIIAARAAEMVMAFVSDKAKEARRFDGLELDEVLARKLAKLKLSLTLPAPPDPAKRSELAKLASQMESTYGKGKYCPERLGGKCLTLGEMSQILAKKRDYDELLDVWQGWRTISPPMRKTFERYVELGNEGARDMGFKDLGALWRSNFDMSPDAFYAETDRLWQQVKPLYDQLHCYMRARLAKVYGADRVSAEGPIPAHLLGNMWAQEWGNLYDLLKPEKADAFNLNEALRAKGYDAGLMVRQAESFFVSLGLDPLPKTFWERSLFVKPRDRDVVCHASAWDVDWRDDLRIKMCIEVNAEDFVTIHHELGHNYYQRAYKDQPPLFTDSANKGFHEALGDVLALSVTPAYLKQIGVIDAEPPDSLNPLMSRALDKIAFLPFGLLVDRWRWDVFSGKVAPDQYNAHWWKLRTQYQGIVPPVERTEKDFDPGAKYHISANVPYTRYFLAAILQFQFHRALCKVAGHEGPLHRCSIYGSKEAGKRLDAMMKMGLSRPWPEAMKALSGEEAMDATAIIDYFKPLLDWLEAENKGAKCGW